MNQKVLKTLEYNKIIDQLTDYAASDARENCCAGNLQPSCVTFRRSCRPRQRPADALTRVRHEGKSFLKPVIRDIRGSLKRLEIGSSLGIPELLSVSSLLTCGRPRQSLRPPRGIRRISG